MSLKKRKEVSKNNKECSTSHHSSGTPLEETRLPCVQEHRTPTCGFLGINFERWQLTHLNLGCIFVRLRNWPFQSQLWAPAGNFMEICSFRWQWIFPALSGILFSDYSEGLKCCEITASTMLQCLDIEYIMIFLRLKDLWLFSGTCL